MNWQIWGPPRPRRCDAGPGESGYIELSEWDKAQSRLRLGAEFKAFMKGRTTVPLRPRTVWRLGRIHHANACSPAPSTPQLSA